MLGGCSEGVQHVIVFAASGRRLKATTTASADRGLAKAEPSLAGKPKEAHSSAVVVGTEGLPFTEWLIVAMTALTLLMLPLVVTSWHISLIVLLVPAIIFCSCNQFWGGGAATSHTRPHGPHPLFICCIICYVVADSAAVIASWWPTAAATRFAPTTASK